MLASKKNTFDRTTLSPKMQRLPHHMPLMITTFIGSLCDRICDVIKIRCNTEGKTKMNQQFLSLLIQKTFSPYSILPSNNTFENFLGTF